VNIPETISALIALIKRWGAMMLVFILNAIIASSGQPFPASPGRRKAMTEVTTWRVFLQHKRFLAPLSTFVRALNRATIWFSCHPVGGVECEVAFENCSMVLPTILNGQGWLFC
jgi:hypothetical protein